MSEPKINIHCDIFQALVSLVSINEKGIDPFAVLHEAQFVIQEVMAGRMDFDTVTPGEDLLRESLIVRYGGGNHAKKNTFRELDEK